MRALRLLKAASSVFAFTVLIPALPAPAQVRTGPSVTVRPASPTVTVRPSTNKAGAVLLIVDGKLAEAELVEVQRGPHVMIWLRDLERLGWGAIEIGPGGEVRFQGRGVTLVFTKGEGVAKVNSLAVRLPIDTYSKDGKLMVPLSFVAKALGYQYEMMPKTVVTIRTSPAARANSISGKAIYNGRPMPGIVVRAVDPEFNVIRSITAKTDADGGFTLSPLPDGRFMAYIYTGDNPLYFNRASEVVEVKGGEEAQVKPIVLGRIIDPLHPKPGSKVSLAKPDIEFAWTSCPGAASYRLRVGPAGKPVPDYDVDSKTASAKLASSKLTAGLSYAVEVVALDAAGEFLGGTAGAGGQQWTFTATK